MSLSIQGQNNGLYQKALHEKNIEHPIKNLLKKTRPIWAYGKPLKAFFVEPGKLKFSKKSMS